MNNANEARIEKLQIAYLDNMLKTKEPYNLKYGAYEIIILPNVFPPYIENQLIIDNVVFNKNDHVLDICSGSGLLAIHAALNCSEVVATDVSPHAIVNIMLNARKYNVQHKVRAINAETYPESNAVRFDKILAIPPFSDKKANSVVERSVWDFQHKTIKTIFARLKDYLVEDGELYLIWSSIGNLNMVFDLSENHGYNVAEIAAINDDLSVYKLFKITFHLN